MEPWWAATVGALGDTADIGMLMGLFASDCIHAEMTYKAMRKYGASPQAARAVLPNAIKTEIVVTADRNEWRLIFGLRRAAAAHPDMQRVANMLYGHMQEFMQ